MGLSSKLARHGGPLASLDSLFLLPCIGADSAVFAGGVADVGSATGVGSTPAAALARLSGEIAELTALADGPSGISDEGDIAQFEAFLSPNASSRTVPATQRSEKVRAPLAMTKRGCGGLPPISEGCAAAHARSAAVNHGLCELLERDAVTRWWHGGCSGLLVADEGNHIVIELEAAVPLPVVVVVAFDQMGCGFAAGAACRSLRADAVAAARREALQAVMGRKVMEDRVEVFGETCLTDVDRAEIARASSIDKCAFLELATNGSAPSEEKAPLDPSETMDCFAPLIVDYGRIHGLAVIKALCPELQPSNPGIRTRRLTSISSSRSLAAETGCAFY